MIGELIFSIMLHQHDTACLLSKESSDDSISVYTVCDPPKDLNTIKDALIQILCNQQRINGFFTFPERRVRYGLPSSPLIIVPSSAPSLNRLATGGPRPFNRQRLEEEDEEEEE